MRSACDQRAISRIHPLSAARWPEGKVAAGAAHRPANSARIRSGSCKRYSYAAPRRRTGVIDQANNVATGFPAHPNTCRHRPTSFYNSLMSLTLSGTRPAADLATGVAWHVGCSLRYKGPQRVGEIRRLSLPVEPSNYLFCVIRRTVATPRRCAYFYPRPPLLAREFNLMRIAHRATTLGSRRTGDTAGQNRCCSRPRTTAQSYQAQNRSAENHRCDSRYA